MTKSKYLCFITFTCLARAEAYNTEGCSVNCDQGVSVSFVLPTAVLRSNGSWESDDHKP